MMVPTFLTLFSLLLSFFETSSVTTIYLIGDSTVADYTLEADYQSKRYPVAGWGQEFRSYFHDFQSGEIPFIGTDSVRVDDRAKGGRSTRTFFQEGRWRAVYEALKPGDIVMVQFGHNDGAVDKTERYVDIEGYKEFLRLFVSQTREKGGKPILLTPVARNYPWKDEHLQNVHREYPDAVKAVAAELAVPLIDLNQLSMDVFSSKGKDYVTTNYFMNLEAGRYPAYPDGQKDNTHFQPAGARAVAGLVFDAMKELDFD
ncbi:rhamnogalacturonan acetylesterase [Parapedobacter tibetensis]|uniref:rhamnogalacturonan acetylesterase n=1 Tax=Parapedobacter tibetensis TaxID=2972951 RepID=UPI00214D2F00|nr:rhamnogalacturonan acetylesterase [Parapedobacter tibetensis]